MMIARAWLALLVLELIGAATLTLLCSDPTRWGLPGKLGLSFGLGLLVLTVSLFLASLCGVPPRWWFGVLELLSSGPLPLFSDDRSCARGYLTRRRRPIRLRAAGSAHLRSG